MIRWDTCRREFEPDGALRDIYVHDMTIEHWRILFDALSATYALEYSVDGTAQPLPKIVDEAFTTRDTASPSLHFRVGGIVVTCHFFTTTEIEFDISPREVTSQAALDELLGFLRLVGDTLGRAVMISYESDEQHPFITYEPSKREFEYHEVAAMNDTLREFVIRRVQLRDDLKPVEIYMRDPPQPIEPDWVAITHGFSRRLDGHNLVFFRFDGTAITSEPFDTLEIALDQAHAIVGIEHSEWEPCHVEITDEDGRISWEKVTNMA